MFFMLNPSLPFFPFLFFFFLQQHFLIMQKQQVRMSNAATTAMAIRAHGGTVSVKNNRAVIEASCQKKEHFDSQQQYLQGILSISFKNLLLISSNMSFLLISVLLEPEVSGAEVEMKGWPGWVGAMVTVVTPVGSGAATASEFLNKLNFIVKD